MKLSYKEHILKFRFEAGTSRGVYREKKSWIIKLEYEGKIGFGEAGPLEGLSIEIFDEIPNKLDQICQQLETSIFPPSEKVIYQSSLQLAGYDFPSIRFALETAMLDVLNGGKRKIFDNNFVQGLGKIPINGLIWMGNAEFMKGQIESKPFEGFECLKMKIGAIDRKEELAIIKNIRKQFPNVVLRLDANGAFQPDEALKLFNELNEYDIHSIEQPIKAGNPKSMQWLCSKSPIPIALDEELITVTTLENKISLLEKIAPHYIILKPSLLGGIAATEEWISIADKRNIGWWITSALESNIGLNAIAQFTAEKNAQSYQGLGTGQLYHNNFNSPLTVDKGYLHYDTSKSWDINFNSLS